VCLDVGVGEGDVGLAVLVVFLVTLDSIVDILLGVQVMLQVRLVLTSYNIRLVPCLAVPDES